MLAAGYILGTDTMDKAKAMDGTMRILYIQNFELARSSSHYSLEKHKISATVSQKTADINEKYHISEKATALGKAAETKASELNEKYKISEKVGFVSESVSNATQKVMCKESNRIVGIGK